MGYNDEFNSDLLNYDETKLYVEFPFGWDGVFVGDTIQMDVSQYEEFNGQFFYFNVIEISNNEIFCTPLNSPKDLYIFPKTEYTTEQTSFKKLTPFGEVECEMLILRPTTFWKWLIFKIKNLFNE